MPATPSMSTDISTSTRNLTSAARAQLARARRPTIPSGGRSRPGGQHHRPFGINNLFYPNGRGFTLRDSPALVGGVVARAKRDGAVRLQDGAGDVRGRVGEQERDQGGEVGR